MEVMNENKISNEIGDDGCFVINKNAKNYSNLMELDLRCNKI